MPESLLTTPDRLGHWADQCATAAMREAAAGCVRPATEWADLGAKLIKLRTALIATDFDEVEVDADVVDERTPLERALDACQEVMDTNPQHTSMHRFARDIGLLLTEIEPSEPFGRAS